MTYKRNLTLLIVTVLAMSALLISCAKFKIGQKTYKGIDWGQAGKQPKNVWPEKDWIIADSERYICVQK